jgi:glyceraldehyde 3-phosphate dehydrogenase
MKIDLVVESTGIFKDKDDAKKHIDAGAKKVLITAFTKTADCVICYGINHKTYNSKLHSFISGASCTTNCLAPVAKALNDEYKIISGLMTTTHAYTSTQRILDAPHKDLRRARAAAVSMIPTTTGAARAIKYVIPEIGDVLDAMAIRIPTPNVSIIDLTCHIDKKTTEDELNAYFKEVAENGFEGVMEYTEEPLVSIDYNTCPASATYDAQLTKVINGNFVKIFAWYDNEWGYSNRMVDIINMVEREG